MRRYWREPPPKSLWSGAVLPRLLSGVVMLGVIYMLYQWAREPGVWTWLAGRSERPSASASSAVGASDAAAGLSGSVENGKAVEGSGSSRLLPETLPPQGGTTNADQAARGSPESLPEGTPPPLPEATGFTDEDPEQLDAAREEFQTLNDGSLKLSPVEMVLYNRMVLWVEHQSFERLQRRARSDLLFTHYHDEVDQYRGQLVTFEMSTRRILDADRSGDGIPLHEVLGVTAESINRLYFAIVVGMPKDIPVGLNVRERVRFAGYYLKLQGYQPYNAKPGVWPERAPLLIGRIERVAVPESASGSADSSRELLWGTIALAVVLGVWAIQFIYFKRRRKRTFARPSARFDAEGKSVAIESWLEPSGRDENEEDSG